MQRCRMSVFCEGAAQPQSRSGAPMRWRRAGNSNAVAASRRRQLPPRQDHGIRQDWGNAEHRAMGRESWSQLHQPHLFIPALVVARGPCVLVLAAPVGLQQWQHLFRCRPVVARYAWPGSGACAGQSEYAESADPGTAGMVGGQPACVCQQQQSSGACYLTCGNSPSWLAYMSLMLRPQSSTGC